MTWASPVDGRGKHRPEQGRTGWALSRGPGVVFRMAAGDPKWSICFLMELSGESWENVTVIDTEIWSDRRANAVSQGVADEEGVLLLPWSSWIHAGGTQPCSEGSQPLPSQGLLKTECASPVS